MIEHWSSVKLNDIVSDFKRGPFGSSIKKSFFVPNGYKVYEQQNAIYDDHVRGRYFINKDKFTEMEDFAVFPGDFIISCSGTIGKISRLPLTAQEGIINQALLRIRLNERIVNWKWFLCLFRSLSFQRRILKETRGSAMKNITGVKELKEVPVDLPSPKEQRVVVDLIEELFSDLDNAIENLKKAREQLKVYRQAVLKYAFQGRFSSGNKDWKELTVDEIGEVITGNTPSKKEKKYYGTEYPLYKPGDLDAGYITVGSLDGLTGEGIKKARMLPSKSILVTCIGATIGKTGLIRKAGACNQQINAIVPKNFMKSEFIYYYCISPQFQEQIKTNASATTLPILNKTKFQRLMFPVPVHNEQEQIVQEIESRFSVCEKLEETIDNNLQKAEALRQSILKQAFAGKLTEQWRKEHKDLINGENSAEALLRKIKADKEALSDKPKEILRKTKKIKPERSK